ncbi:MAG: thiamine pyrophosphate-binding protein [Actinobacteria bacterium]|nr:thiamine pyrophosphate-binding protein [Actinomycetota bacterium]MDI6831563.1 thiamine pyrophosphate-binding protein [Actinomycetota bacterium]
MNCAQVLIEGIKAMGAKRIYGVIGTSNLSFVDALYDHRKELRYVSCRHEQVAASMADAEGRLTGIPGVALTHSGPGTFNALISVGNAYKDCSPMILLSGAVKRKLKGSDGMLEADHMSVFAPMCKGVFRIEDAGQAAAVFSRAYTLAVSGARGPVLIEVPEDVWGEEGGMGSPRFRLAPDYRPPLHVEDVWRALELFKGARRPLLLSGGGVAYARCSELLVRLAEALQAPVITTGNGRGTIPEDHPLCLGRAGFGGGNTVADTALSEAEVVLGLGCTLSDMTTYEYTLPVKGEVILVNIDLEAMLTSRFRARYMIEADVRDFLAEALGAVKEYRPPSRDEWWGLLEPVRQEWRKAVEAAVTSDRVPLSPGRVVHELSRLLPPGHVVTVGGGTHSVYAMDFLPCREPLSYLSAVNFGAMGFGFPAALAAKLVYPEKEVVAILGDGDFMMTLQDLETACREGIAVRVLVINDNMYRVLNLRQRLQCAGRILGTCHGNPDFAALARTFGAAGWRLERPEEIVPVLREALSAPGPAVVDAIIDPDDLPPMNIEATLRMGMG